MNEDFDLNDYYDIPYQAQIQDDPLMTASMAGSKSPKRGGRSPQRGKRPKSVSPKGKRSGNQQQRGFADDPSFSRQLFVPGQQQQQRPQQQVNFQEMPPMAQPMGFGRRLSDSLGPQGQKQAMMMIGGMFRMFKPLVQAVSSAILFMMIVFFMILIMMEILTSNVVFRASPCCR